MTTPAQNVRDPETFGEDLIAITNRAAELARTYCGECSTFHWRVPAQRAVGLPESLVIDRAEMVKAIRTLWKRPPENGKFEIVIAGTADTGLLATAAHAVATLSADALSQTHFTVIDLCRTPLQLCAEFSAAHGFECSTMTSDLRDTTIGRPVDLLIMHSVLRFLSAEERILFLRRVRSWLVFDGRVLISNSFGLQTQSQREAKLERSRLSSQRIKQAVLSGLLRTPIAVDDLLKAQEANAKSSVDRDRVFLEPLDLERMAQASGFGITQLDFIRAPDLKADVPGRSRLLAILEPDQT